MERLGRLHDHNIDIDRAIALSLAEEEEKQVVKELQEEEEEFLVAVTCLQTQEELKKEENNLTELRNQEETQVEIALALSQADFDEESFSDISTDDLEYIFNEVVHLNPESFPTENEPLAEMYRNYRVVPTFFTETQMWPLSAINRQKQELAQCLGGREKVTVWQNNMCESHRCLICLTNVGTRFASPCGHRLCCPTCLPELVNKCQFYSVTAPNGEVVATDRRIPLQCFTCRAIIGHTVVPILV
uniref:RING-type domain-containing protein n=1 Tax=Homalodisca liturata TaxID=320908 RepID=A0A1B6I3P6_9HEMI